MSRIKILLQRYNKRKMDNAGIDPATYRMQSDRSTIWANYPHHVGEISIFQRTVDLWDLKKAVFLSFSIQSIKYRMALCGKRYLEGKVKCKEDSTDLSKQFTCLRCNSRV